MGSKSNQSKHTRLDDETRATIKRIAYEHGMSFEDAMKYYMRNV